MSLYDAWLSHLTEDVAYDVELALDGGYARQPFDETANEFVWVVRKPG